MGRKFAQLREYTSRKDIRQVDRFYREEVFPKHLLDTRPYNSLSAVAKDFFLFSVSIPYVFGGLTDKVWFDLSGSLGVELPLFFWKSPAQLFAGFEAIDSSWNYVLFASLKTYQLVIEEQLLSSVFLDQVARRAVGFGEQKVRVQDSLLCRSSVSSSGVLPVVEIVSFGINGSDRIVALSPVDRTAGMPTVFSQEGDPEMLAYFQKVSADLIEVRDDETGISKAKRDEDSEAFRTGEITVPADLQQDAAGENG